MDHKFQSLDVADTRSPDGLLHMTVGSNALDRRVDITLFAPAGCDPAAELPLIILLHGVYGSHWAWSRSGHAHETLQALVDSNQIGPAVLVMPSDGLFGVGSGYLARPEEDADRWITEELPQAVNLIHPRAGKSKISIAGLSMGGWGALRLAARHPGHFANAVGLSPLTHIDQVAAYATPEWAIRHAPPIADADLLGLVVAERSRMPPTMITCGTEDALLDNVRQLHHGLLDAGITHAYDESVGGHDWTYWTNEMAPAFRFMDRNH